MFNIIGKRFWFFLISGVVILIGIISLATFGLKSSIEFSSGSIVKLSFEQKIQLTDLKQEITSLGYSNAIVQSLGSNEFLVRTSQLTDKDKTTLESSLADKFGKLTEAEFDSVSPMVAGETVKNAAIAVALASLGILLYVSWAFRRMPKPFHYGTCAVVGLLHDALIALGIYSILGGLLGWEINMMFITGILAVIGYSVNNTVVVFDRIRENLIKGISPDFEVVVNSSLVETLGRCMNTSLTTILVILALLFFVGGSIQNFAVVLLVGVIAGTFSSTCIAPPLLVVWERREWGRFLPWLSSSRPGK